MADIPSSTDACVQVQHALSGEEVASIVIPATCSVRELKTRLEEPTGIPAEYQTLLHEGGVVPLRDTASLLDEGLHERSTVLFTSQRPEKVDLELWRVCQGCACGFGEEPYGYCTDLSMKKCGCERDPGSAPRVTQVKYLLANLSEDVSFLQPVFERLVLAGGPEAYTLVAEHLAKHPSINVNAQGCACSEPPRPSLLEVTLDYHHVDMIRMLLDTGRLQVDFDLTCLRLERMKEEDHRQIWWAAGSLNSGPRDWESIVNSIVENLDTREEMVCKFITEQGWQSEPFCEEYHASYQKAIEHVLWYDIKSMWKWAQWES